MPQDKNYNETNSHASGVKKQDFMIKPKITYSNTFTLEKDSAIPETPKKKQSNKVLSWILAIFIFAVSLGIIGGIFYLKSQDIKAKDSLADTIFAYNGTFTDNLNIRKTPPSLGITNKKYDVPIMSEGFGIYELNSGKVIAEQNADAKLSFASITKLLTVATMESVFNSNTMFNVSPVGVNILGSRADIRAGDKFNYTDAVYGMMLPSGNDVAMSVAMQYGYDKFITKMNDISSALNLKNTKISNPVGFDDKDKQYSSVRDIFAMSRFYLQKDLNKTVAQTKEYTIKSQDSSQSGYLVKNTNDLLNQAEVYGLKTGTEDLAGQCLVLYLKVKGKEYIAVMLGSQDRFKEGQKIIDWLKTNS